MSRAGSPRRRVLFLVPSLRRAGAETQTVDLVNALDADRFETHLGFFEARTDLLDRVDARQVQVHRLERRRKLDLGLVRHIARLIEQNGIEIVYCTLQISLFFALLSRLWTRSRPRLVAAIHTTMNRSLREELYDRLLYRRMLRRCDRVLFVCRAQAEHWGRKYPEIGRLAAVVYNGVDPDRYDPEHARASGSLLRQQLGIPPRDRVISCIAGLRPEKGHEFLVEAFAALSGAPWLLLAGDGPERRRITELVRHHGVEDRVCFLGEVPDVRPVIAASDATALASVAVETFSIAMLESMAMAVPVIATDVGGLAEAVSAGETGEIVRPRDVPGLRRALQRVLDDDEARREMGRRARDRVHASFSQQAMALATAQLLSGLLEGSASGGRTEQTR